MNNKPMTKKEYVKLIKDLYSAKSELEASGVDWADACHEVAESLLMDIDGERIEKFLTKHKVSDIIGRLADDIYVGSTFFK